MLSCLKNCYCWCGSTTRGYNNPAAFLQQSGRNPSPSWVRRWSIPRCYQFSVTRYLILHIIGYIAVMAGFLNCYFCYPLRRLFEACLPRWQGQCPCLSLRVRRTGRLEFSTWFVLLSLNAALEWFEVTDPFVKIISKLFLLTSIIFPLNNFLVLPWSLSHFFRLFPYFVIAGWLRITDFYLV